MLQAEIDRIGFVLSNRSHSGLMYESGGAKSIWEPSFAGQSVAMKSPTSTNQYNR